MTQSFGGICLWRLTVELPQLDVGEALPPQCLGLVSDTVGDPMLPSTLPQQSRRHLEDLVQVLLRRFELRVGIFDAEQL